MARANSKRPVMDRLMEKVAHEDHGYATRCWIFKGARHKYGYGVLSMWPSNPEVAHRLTYQHFVGPIPDGKELDHLCRVPACCNPEHLEPVTHQENLRRGRSSEALRAKYAAITHCKHGHEFTPENLRWKVKNGYQTRVCLKCARDQARKRRRHTHD